MISRVYEPSMYHFGIFIPFLCIPVIGLQIPLIFLFLTGFLRKIELILNIPQIAKAKSIFSPDRQPFWLVSLYFAEE